MFLRMLLLSCLLSGILSAQPQQGGTVRSTTVREDIFSGLMAGDLDRLQSRFERIKPLATQTVKGGGFFAWKGMCELVLAVHAHEAGNADGFASYYEAAKHSFAEAERLAPGNVGVDDVSGAAWGGLGDRLPPSLRADAHERAYRSWQRAYVGSESQGRFAVMTPHGRGEMLAGIVHSAHRTSRPEEVRRRLQEMVAVLPGTAFEDRAKKWLAQPELITRSTVSCQSCHPQERLSAVTAKPQ